MQLKQDPNAFSTKQTNCWFKQCVAFVLAVPAIFVPANDSMCNTFQGYYIITSFAVCVIRSSDTQEKVR